MGNSFVHCPCVSLSSTRFRNAGVETQFSATCDVRPRGQSIVDSLHGLEARTLWSRADCAFRDFRVLGVTAFLLRLLRTDCHLRKSLQTRVKLLQAQHQISHRVLLMILIASLTESFMILPSSSTSSASSSASRVSVPSTVSLFSLPS